MGQAKARGSFEQRQVEGIQRRLKEQEQWDKDRARRMAEDIDPLVTRAIAESVADFGNQLFSKPKIKVKRWK